MQVQRYDPRWGTLPTEEENGVALDGTLTTLGFCDCGCGHHQVIGTDGKGNLLQTMAARITYDDSVGFPEVDNFIVLPMKRIGMPTEKILDIVFSMLAEATAELNSSDDV